MIHLVNKKQCRVLLTDVGAGIVSVLVPDKNNQLRDIVLGYSDEESYYNDGPCSGKIPGRFAGRIAKGKFSIDGKEFQLRINNGENHLHGGPAGFANKKWNVVEATDQRVIFSLTSPDGDENYPGTMEVTAEYNWSDENILSLDIKARCDKDTIVNLTNHTYWNLKGEDSGSILDHFMTIHSEKWLPTDAGLVPTGEFESVENTPMDFRNAKKIGQEINNDFQALKFGKGYDNCWMLEEKEGVKKGVELFEETSGLALEVWTNQPAVVIYTGNWLAGSPESKSNRSYNDYDGVAIECQGCPDAPNHKKFPNAILRAGEEYHNRIEFRIKTIE